MSVHGKRAAGLLMVALGALALGRCGGGGSPAGPSTPSVPPVTSPTPTPAPTADPPISQSCAKLPPGALTTRCEKVNPEYVETVGAAIRTLQREKAYLFDGDRVLSPGAFYVEVIKILDRQGLCADTEGEELGVTDSASSNEQYDIITANGVARFGPVTYMTTCTPSSVPISRSPRYPAPAGCSLAPSVELSCGREPEGRYLDDVLAAIAQIQKDKPELFDYNDIAGGNPAVRNIDAYFQGIVSIMVQKGYCARHDGEELQLKQGSNQFNEQYDIDLQHKYVRTGTGIYRSSCYPSAF